MRIPSYIVSVRIVAQIYVKIKNVRDFWVCLITESTITLWFDEKSSALFHFLEVNRLPRNFVIFFVNSSSKFIHLTIFCFWCEIWNVVLNLFLYKFISTRSNLPAILTFSNQDIVQKAKDDLVHWSLNQLLLSKKNFIWYLRIKKKSDILYRDIVIQNS